MLDYKFITHIKNYLFKYIYRFKVNKFCKKLKKTTSPNLPVKYKSNSSQEIKIDIFSGISIKTKFRIIHEIKNINSIPSAN